MSFSIMNDEWNCSILSSRIPSTDFSLWPHPCLLRVALISLVIGRCMQTRTLCPNCSSSISLKPSVSKLMTPYGGGSRCIVLETATTITTTTTTASKDILSVTLFLLSMSSWLKHNHFIFICFP